MASKLLYGQRWRAFLAGLRYCETRSRKNNMLSVTTTKLVILIGHNDVWALFGCRVCGEHGGKIHLHLIAHAMLSTLSLFSGFRTFPHTCCKGTSMSMPFNMKSLFNCFYMLLQLHSAFPLPSVPSNNPLSLSLIQIPTASNLSKPTCHSPLPTTPTS